MARSKKFDFDPDDEFNIDAERTKREQAEAADEAGKKIEASTTAEISAVVEEKAKETEKLSKAGTEESIGTSTVGNAVPGKTDVREKKKRETKKKGEAESVPSSDEVEDDPLGLPLKRKETGLNRSVYFSRELYNKLEKYSSERGVKFSVIVNSIIEKYFEERGV